MCGSACVMSVCSVYKRLNSFSARGTNIPMPPSTVPNAVANMSGLREPDDVRSAIRRRIDSWCVGALHG